MRPGDSRCGQQGFAFVATLVLLALCMLGLSVAGPSWSQQARRERERDLLRIGVLYARAIQSYRDASPGSIKQNPPTLQALLLDTRFVGTQRHLRKLYADPVGHGQPWSLLLDKDQRIVGVYSRSQEAPIAEGPLDLGPVKVGAAKRYADWKFTPNARANLKP